MQKVAAFQAKTHFSALLEQVENGEQIIITKHGHPVARLSPIATIDRAHVKLAIHKIKAFGKSHTLGDYNWKELRDEGRR